MTAIPIPYKQVHTLKGHDGPVLCCRFNTNGGYALTGGQDRSIRLWNPHKGTLIKTYSGHSQGVHGLTVTQDNSQIVSCGGDKIAFVWDVETGRALRKFRGHHAQVNTIAMNQESTLCVTGSYDRTVRIWDCKSSNDTIPIQVLDDFKDSVTAVHVSEDMREIIASSVDGFVRRYDIRNGKLLQDCVGVPVVSLAVTRDDNCMLAGCLDGVLRLFEKQTGGMLASYKGHSNTNHKVESMFTNTDAHVIAGSEDGSIYFWELVSEAVVHTLKAHKSTVCSLDYHPTAQCMISSSVDGTCKVWK